MEVAIIFNKFRFSIILVISICFFSSVQSAEIVTVKELKASIEGEVLVLTYDLTPLENKLAKVIVELSTDGKNWINVTQALGDFGQSVQSGINKKITIDLYDYYPDGITSNLYFRVETQAEKSLLEPEMIYINKGEFLMGSPSNELGRGNDEIQHLVEIKAFEIGKTEITYEQFNVFVSDTGYLTASEK